MISLTQLEYIVAIDTYRHFATAAEKCMVTQPTLSMQIKKVEEALKVSIFDRTKQPVIPTAIGKLIIEQARNVLRESGKIGQIISDHKQNIQGHLKIGIIPTLAPYLLPYFLGDLIKKNPKVQLSIRELMTEDIIGLLKKDALDVGIVATPLLEDELKEDPIFYEEIMLYVHPKHPLTERKRIDPTRINKKELWMLSQGNCFRDHVINLCHLDLNEEGRNLRYESGSIETLKKMVEIEGGATLLPELAVLELSTRKLKQVKGFISPKPLREISLVYYRNMAKISLIDHLKSYILSNIPEELSNKKRGTIVQWK